MVRIEFLPLLLKPYPKLSLASNSDGKDSFFIFLKIYWSIVDLQCCVVSAVERAISVIHIHMPSIFLGSFPI